MPTISPIYAGLIALLFIYLSLRIITVRRGQKISLGDGGDKDMARRIRVQGNCAEYAPIALILLAMVEQQGAPVWLVHLLGLILLLGRVMHAWGLGQVPQNLPGRIYGMALTLGMIAAAALLNIVYALT